MADTSTRFGVPRELMAQRQGGVRAIGASSIPTVQYSTGSAKALRDFSFDMFKVSSNIEDRLDQTAHAEADLEGATDGATGNFEARDYDTIRGRAYNKAGIDTFVSTLETRSIVMMAELRQKHAGDPAGLQAAMSNYYEGVGAEIDKVSPGAGAMYRQRQTVRSMNAVEQAKDAAYSLTKDQADAAMIENEIALNAELEEHSADLFSENPARSQAAANAIGIVGQELMRVYSAVDPVTGRPLYSATQRAKAQAEFKEKVFSNATLSWFEGQEDKGAAYIKFMEGDFKIDLKTSVASVDIVDETAGKIRNKPITADVRGKLSTAVSATGTDLSVALVSGGQDDHGPHRTGSTRHDHGHAGDVVLMRNGEKVTPEQDPELYERFVENAAAAGFTGIGHYPWGIHVGGGSVAAWGPDKTGKTLDPKFGAAIARGRQNPLDTKGGLVSMDIQKMLSPVARKRLDSEMRAQIAFKNKLADRADAAEEKELKANQDNTFFTLTDQILNGDGAVTRELVQRGVDDQEIDPADGRALMKMLTTDAPDNSDPELFKDLLAKSYEGEDIKREIIAASGQLSKSDFASLMAKNNTMNVAGDGSLSDIQRAHLSMLKDVLTPEANMKDIDPGSDVRKNAALDEFYLRVGEGENSRDVMRDLTERAARDFEGLTISKLDRLVTPRFSVNNPSRAGFIDVRATLVNLKKKHAAGEISDQSFTRQIELAQQWDKVQKVVK